MSSNRVLEVRNLSTHIFTSRGVNKAVNDVSFHLDQGETLGIVGESGSGKSMTALSLLRLVPQPAARIVAGEIWINGEEVLGKSSEEMRRVRGKEISMILQDPQSSLNPVFRIGNQVTEALGRRQNQKARGGLREIAVDILRKVGIADPERRREDYPHQMSGGMKQRVVGGISVALEPRIIIADEPTTSLDVTIQAQYLRLLRDIQTKNNVGIIFITHDFGIVSRMCDRVAVMYAGRIVEQGSTKAIFESPSHPYTHALINSVPRMDRKMDRLFSIPGNPPSGDEETSGCPFAARCPHVDDRCREEHPPWFPGLSGDSNQSARCWRLEDPEWQPRRF